MKDDDLNLVHTGSQLHSTKLNLMSNSETRSKNVSHVQKVAVIFSVSLHRTGWSWDRYSWAIKRNYWQPLTSNEPKPGWREFLEGARYYNIPVLAYKAHSSSCFKSRSCGSKRKISILSRHSRNQAGDPSKGKLQINLQLCQLLSQRQFTHLIWEKGRTQKD